jgi:hypothetical protein
MHVRFGVLTAVSCLILCSLLLDLRFGQKLLPSSEVKTKTRKQQAEAMFAASFLSLLVYPEYGGSTFLRSSNKLYGVTSQMLVTFSARIHLQECIRLRHLEIRNHTQLDPSEYYPLTKVYVSVIISFFCIANYSLVGKSLFTRAC